MINDLQVEADVKCRIGNNSLEGLLCGVNKNANELPGSNSDRLGVRGGGQNSRRGYYKVKKSKDTRGVGQVSAEPISCQIGKAHV